MSCLRNWIILVGLAARSMSQKTGLSTSVAVTSIAMTAATMSTTTSQTIAALNPLNTPHPLSSYVWHIPFAGISDNASDAWGPSGWASPRVYAIAINDSNPVPPLSATTRSTDLISEARAENDGMEDTDYLLDITTSGGSAMVLGTNSALDATYGGTKLNESVPTVPFGLNLGQKDTWEGSLILGGSEAGASYDASRVATGSWVYVPESANSNGSFLKTGKQQLTNITIQQYVSSPLRMKDRIFGGAKLSTEPTTYSAILDINSDAIVLPRDLNLCNATNFTVTLNTRSIEVNGLASYQNNLVISIPTSLTRSTDRCFTSSTNTTNTTIILGRPFFQAAYLMIPDTTGQMWLTAAHQYQIFPKSELFFPNQTLIAAPNPSPTPTSRSTSSPSSTSGATSEDSKSKTASIIGGTLGAVFGLALLSWIVFLIFRYRKIVRSHHWKPMSTETELLTRIPREDRERRSSN